MNSIILIGMPGAGKSTVGIVLAKVLGLKFCDTDLLIQNGENMLLQDIINQHGNEYFKKAEENHILMSTYENSVVATGGSAVYGEAAMRHLKKYGNIVYLYVEREELKRRLGDTSQRGIAGGTDIDTLFTERKPLYEKYAEITVDCTGLEIKECIEIIRNKINEFNNAQRSERACYE